MEPSETEYVRPLKIGNLYLNRFTIDEDAAFEIIGVHELSTSRYELKDEEWKALENVEFEELISKTDKETLASAAINALQTWSAKTDVHVVYAGLNYITQFLEPEILDQLIVDILNAIKLKSLMITVISMERNSVITKEVMKDCYKGIFHKPYKLGFDRMSVHDDLDLLFEQTKYGQIINPSYSSVYFLPKLTDDELLLLKNKNKDYLKTFSIFHHGQNPDVDVAEMIKSKSKSKFAYCMCTRISRRFSSKYK